MERREEQRAGVVDPGVDIQRDRKRVHTHPVIVADPDSGPVAQPPPVGGRARRPSRSGIVATMVTGVVSPLALVPAPRSVVS